MKNYAGEYLGEGAFSVVYKVCKNGVYSVEKHVDIMNLVRKYTNKPKNSKVYQKYVQKMKELTENEIKVLYELNNDRIIKLLETSMSPTFSSYTLSFEYCNGGDLYSVLKSEPKLYKYYRNRHNGFDYTFLMNVMSQMISGLQYIHKRGFIHRDIKAQNILLVHDSNYDTTKSIDGSFIDVPSIKISDFGFVCSTNQDCPLYKSKYNNICGTPYYMAPEMLKLAMDPLLERTYTFKVDLWGLGVILFELIWNMLPVGLCLPKTIESLIEYYKNHTVSLVLDENTEFTGVLKGLLTLNPVNRITLEETRLLLDKLEEQLEFVDDTKDELQMSKIDCKPNCLCCYEYAPKHNETVINMYSIIHMTESVFINKNDYSTVAQTKENMWSYMKSVGARIF